MSFSSSQIFLLCFCLFCGCQHLLRNILSLLRQEVASSFKCFLCLLKCESCIFHKFKFEPRNHFSSRNSSNCHHCHRFWPHLWNFLLQSTCDKFQLDVRLHKIDSDAVFDSGIFWSRYFFHAVVNASDYERFSAVSKKVSAKIFVQFFPV